jgi:hypothetical protein
VRTGIFHVMAIACMALVGCSVPKVDLVADRSIVLVERAPKGVHLQAGAIEEDGNLIIRGTIHSEHANEVVYGHLHVSVVEPDGEKFCEVRLSIREERSLVRQLPKRGMFAVHMPGLPQQGSTLVVEYHPRGV